ncbi:MAG: hypothetical protein ACR2QS_13155 [Woeseiaceae bacterium]
MNRIMTATIIVLLLLLVSGCTTTSAPELSDQPEQTDEWTVVESQFEDLDRAVRETSKMCPKRTKPWCEHRTGKVVCSCTDDTLVRERLASMWAN